MIDLRSDTVTTPTDAMREAAATADVGDDVKREDPSVNALESRAAKLLGKEAALFVPSGTMGNQVAVLTHTTPGQEIVLEEESHIYNWEVGGVARLGGLQVRALSGGSDGLYHPPVLRRAIVEESLHQAGTGLVCVENTHNHAGGVPHHPNAIAKLADVAENSGIPLHIDGARLCNAAVALDMEPAAVAAPADSVMLSLSKGLGAPVGSILAGPQSFIDEARRWRKRLGGGMRQAGIIAAPARIGLENWERLEQDHDLARRLADGLATIDGLTVQPPETNIVLLEVSGTGMDAAGFVEACDAAGVGCVEFGQTVVRCCTHRDLDDEAIDEAIERIESTLTA